MIKFVWNPLPLVGLALSVCASASSFGAELKVLDESGAPLAQVMVTQSLAQKPSLTLDELGYPIEGETHQSALESTGFTTADGLLELSSASANTTINYRLRKPGYKDLIVANQTANTAQTFVLKRQTDPDLLAAAKPSNVWLSQLDFSGDEGLRKHFQLNCAFCHQQASSFMRNERSVDQWLEIIQRMNAYGARTADKDHRRLAEILSAGYKKLRSNAHSLPEPRAWDASLSEVSMTEYPIGDAFSQMHDFLIHPNGFIYVGDNLFDRIYEIEPDTGKYNVYKVPHLPGMKMGGVLGNRFKTYPKMDNFMGVHSFAVSPVDGHIFITPSMQQALLEFDPETKAFTIHEMNEGYYPHTIRADAQDRIWFTLAVSSQIGMWDRKLREFKLYDLPARSIKEWAIIKSLPLILSLDPETRPLPSVDRQSTGVPMPYGIDVAPDGTVWFARLYGNDIGFIDPENDSVTMIKTPFKGPRRLRVDADGDIWIVAFQDSQLAKYDPKAKAFTRFDLPLMNELPYSLNIDRARAKVWINGNQSDTIFSFDIKTQAWKVFPLSRKRTFTRDIEVGEDGSIYTSNSHFPAWQIEDGQPTLIRLQLP